MLEHLSSRERKLGIFASALAAAFVLQLLVIKPITSKLNSTRDQIRSQAVTLAKYMKVLGHKERIEKIYGEYLGVVKVGGTPQEEISKFLQEVDQICQKAGVHIVDMKPMGLKEENSLKKVRLQIEVDARQASLGRLLFELKNSQAMIHVDSLNASAASRGEALKCRLILSRILAS